MYSTVVGFTLKAKLVSSKHLIQVHLETLSRSVENMAAHLLAKAVNLDLSVHQNLGTAASAACTSCKWRPYLFLVRCVLKCGVAYPWWGT